MDLLERVGAEVEDHLAELERRFPRGRFKLTFVARYTLGDLPDADMVVTSEDDLETVRAALLRRIEVGR